MTALVRELVAEARSLGAPELPVLRGLVLARVAAEGGATRAGLVRDLTPMTAHRLSPAEWRARAETELTALLAARLVTESRGRFDVSQTGREAADAFIGLRGGSSRAWVDQRDVALVAKALGVAGEGSSAIKALAKPEGLRALVVQKAFGLPLKGNVSASKLRSDLAVVALERAFGNKIKRGLGAGAGSGLSAKAGRVLAGQLSRTPQDYGSDGRLVAALAAEQSGAVQTDHEAVRLALLRGLVSHGLAAGGAASLGRPTATTAAQSQVVHALQGQPQSHLPAQAQPSQPLAHSAHGNAPSAAPSAANDTVPLSTRPAGPLAAATRPDMETFAAEVRAAALTRAEGWSGNRKAFISLVWHVIRDSRADWGLTEIEFKCMLAEAHRAGHVVLANADLKDKLHIKELQDSAIAYKNTVWHFVRVDE